MADLHDLAPFYVLDALSDDERAAFERHLESCADCRREIADLSHGVETLARSVAEPAPDAMKAEVMAAIDAEAGGEDDASDPAGGDVIPLRSPTSRVVTALVAVAAVVAVIVGVGLGSSDPRQETLDSLLASPDSVVVEATTEVASFAEVVYEPDAGTGAFVAGGLESVPEGSTYQLWLIGDEGPVSAGVFRPEDDGSAVVLLDGEVRPGLTLGLTVEPAGGSEAPTGDILLAEEI